VVDILRLFIHVVVLWSRGDLSITLKIQEHQLINLQVCAMPLLTPLLTRSSAIADKPPNAGLTVLLLTPFLLDALNEGNSLELLSSCKYEKTRMAGLQLCESRIMIDSVVLGTIH